MSEIIDVQQATEVPEPYTPKQLLGKLKTFEDLEDVVFYVPFVYDLIQDQERTVYPTDMFSHSLMQVLDHHPLVITELAEPVFRAKAPILLTSLQKGFERTIYAVPKEAWGALAENIQMMTAVDKTTHRFCIFRMYEEEIPCPLGNHKDKMIKVWYCNLYGNKETYYYAKGLDENGNNVMHLHYSPPIREVVELGDKLLKLLQHSKDSETAYETFAEDSAISARLLAIQKNDKMQKVIAAKPLEESQLTPKQRADCYEMIQMYHQMYGDVPV
jgi:hypothetical protein